MKTFLKRTLGVLGLVCSLVGCGGGGSSSSLPDPTVRFVNSSPDSTGLDFVLTDEVKASNVPYAAANPSLISVSVKDYDVAVRTPGSTVDQWSESQTLSTDHDYAIIGIGLQNFGTEPLKRLRVMQVDYDRHKPNANKARLIVCHTFLRSTGFETPDIDFRNPGDNPQFSITDIAYGSFKSIDVDSGVQTFQARRNGAEQVYVEKSLTLESGKIYLVLFNGVEGASNSTAPDLKLIELASRSG